MTKKNHITKKDALEAWNAKETRVLFEMYFQDFDEYWEACENFNHATPAKQKERVRAAMKKLNDQN